MKQPGVLILPAAYDCMSARIVEKVGCKAVFLSPGMTCDAQLSMPNIGLSTSSELINCAKYMANSVNIPLIMGADDGFGSALAAYRTTQEAIGAGVDGIIISDQINLIPVKTPHNLAEVVPRDKYLGKIGAVLEARNKKDKDFIIVARIDAGATMGDEEVIIRAKACVKLGVDMILPHAVPFESKFKQKDKEGLSRFYKLLGAPDVLIWWGMAPQGFTAKDCEDIEAKVWVPPASPMDAVKKVLFDVYQEVRDTGNYTPLKGVTLDKDFSKHLRGKEFWRELEKKYVE